MEGCEQNFARDSTFKGQGGRGGGDSCPLMRQDQFLGVMRGTILNGEHLDNLVGELAGDGISRGKAKGGGLRIAVTLFFYEHVLSCVRGGQRRNGQTKRFLMLPTVTIRPGSAPLPGG